MFKLNIVFTASMVIYNNYVGLSKEMINSTILIVKQHIYANKWLKCTITFRNLLTNIFEMERIGKRIANVNGTYTKFYKNGI